MKTLPDFIILYFAPGFRKSLALRDQMSTQIKTFTDDTLLEVVEHDTIYHHLLDPPKNRYHEVPSTESLLDEALALLQVGSETVAHAYLLGAVYGLKDSEVKMKLAHELHDTWPDQFPALSFESLEKLTYLVRFISLDRWGGIGVVTPMARVLPKEAMVGAYKLPASTIVSGVTFMHDNQQVFPEPGFSAQNAGSARTGMN